MKKILSVLLSLFCVVSLYTANTTAESNGIGMPVPAVYTVTGDFEFVIPSEPINMTLDNPQAQVEIIKNTISADRLAKISIYSSNNWNMYLDETNSFYVVPYKTMIGDHQVSNNEILIKAYSKEHINDPITLSFVVDETSEPEYAGEYKDILTFMYSQEYLHGENNICEVSCVSTTGVLIQSGTYYGAEGDTRTFDPIEIEGYTGSTEDIIVKFDGTMKELELEYEPISYTITYHLDDGTGPEEANPETYTIEDEIYLNEPTKEGYSFMGWYTEDTFTNKIETIECGSIGNLDLYAKWQKELGKGVKISINNHDFIITKKLEGDSFDDYGAPFELLSLENYTDSHVTWDDDGSQKITIGDNTYLNYDGSLVDLKMNGDSDSYYSSLSDDMKSALIPKTVVQSFWKGIDGNWPIGQYTTQHTISNQKNVYVLDILDVFEYFEWNVEEFNHFDNDKYKQMLLTELFPENKGQAWLRSSCSNGTSYAFYVSPKNSNNSTIYAWTYNVTDVYGKIYYRPAFQIDLSKVDYTIVE